MTTITIILALVLAWALWEIRRLRTLCQIALDARMEAALAYNTLVTRLAALNDSLHTSNKGQNNEKAQVDPDDDATLQALQRYASKAAEQAD